MGGWPIILHRIFRIFLILIGIGLLIWSFVDPTFRDLEGSLKGTVCFPLTWSAALLLLGCTVGGPFTRFALWLALAMVGQAAALQLIDAGKLLHYQHYKTLGQSFESYPLALGVLITQFVLIIFGLRRLWSRVIAWLTRIFRTWQLIVMALVFVLSSATVSERISFYLAELGFASIIQFVNLGNIILGALAFPRNALASFHQQFLKVVGNASKTEKRILDRFSVTAAVWVTALAIVFSIFSYECHPHITDEVAYLFHARLLASGNLTLPAPPVPAAFEVNLIQVEKDRWYPSPPPGWPLILALGVKIGPPWLVNPLLAGVNLLLVYILLCELYDRRIGRIGLLLLCCSPWFLFMGMNLMTHMLTLTCALVASISMLRASSTARLRWGGLAGIAVGIASLIRPVDGLIIGVIVGLASLLARNQPSKYKSIAAFVIASAITGALVFPYNKFLTGNPTVYPINAYNDQHSGKNANAYGFGPDRGMGWAIDPYPGHSPIDAIVNANLNTFSINIELFGWSTGSLILFLVILFSRTLRRNDYLMIGAMATVFIAYFFYYFSGGPDFGARYWFLMLVPLIALTARGIQFVGTRLNPHGDDTRILVAVVSLMVLSFLNYLPWRAIDKYHRYLQMRPDIRELEKVHAFGNSLVLIRGSVFPDYASAAIYNPLDLTSPSSIYAWDRNREVRMQVTQFYSDRKTWIVDGPTITGNGYRVHAGPLSSEKLLESIPIVENQND